METNLTEDITTTVEDITHPLDEIEFHREMLHEKAIVIAPKDVLARGGKPPDLTFDIIRTVCMNLATGATKEVAARAAGVHRRSLARWQERGKAALEMIVAEEPITEYQAMCAYLTEMLDIVEAGAEIHLINLVLKDGASGAKWILTRRHPERWAPKGTVVHQHEGIIKLTWGNIDAAEELEASAQDTPLLEEPLRETDS